MGVCIEEQVSAPELSSKEIIFISHHRELRGGKEVVAQW